MQKTNGFRQVAFIREWINVKCVRSTLVGLYFYRRDRESHTHTHTHTHTRTRTHAHMYIYIYIYIVARLIMRYKSKLWYRHKSYYLASRTIVVFD